MAQIRPLVPELAEIARIDLNENEACTEKAIDKIRTWIAEQPYLRARDDDQFIVAFLRFCKYDMEATKKRIDYFYTYKSTAGDLLKTRSLDSKIYSINQAGIFATLPKPVGPAGPRIHFTRMANINTSLFSIQDIFRFHVFRSEIEVNTDDNWIISGVLEIIDFSKIPFSLLRQFEASIFRKMAAFLEYGVPTNLKGTHIVNASKEAQIILSLVRLAMKEKELLHIHSSLESLQTSIGKEYLPVEYGGDNGTLDEAIAHFEQQLDEYKDYFNEDINYGVDEKLRSCNKLSTKSSTNSAGSCFRKLDID